MTFACLGLVFATFVYLDFSEEDRKDVVSDSVENYKENKKMI